MFANGATTVSASATDPDGTIASVQFFANGISLGAVTAFPYTLAWTPTAEGVYSLSALAIDNGGNSTRSSAISVTATAAGAPTVNLTTSAAGGTSTVNSPVTLNANATAAFGRTVASVQFLANGVNVGAADTTFPYSTTWTPTAPGVYAITATATDDIAVSGTSSAVNITITAGTPPAVNLTSPGNGSTIAVSTAKTITATATRAVDEADAARADYLKRFYGIKQEHPTQYDVVVNTDADDQYDARDLPALMQPILRGEAEYVVDVVALRDGDAVTDVVTDDHGHEQFFTLRDPATGVQLGFIARTGHRVGVATQNILEGFKTS